MWRRNVALAEVKQDVAPSVGLRSRSSSSLYGQTFKIPEAIVRLSAPSGLLRDARPGWRLRVDGLSSRGRLFVGCCRHEDAGIYRRQNTGA